MVSGRRLGLHVPKQAPMLRVERLLTGEVTRERVVPAHPEWADWMQLVPEWGLYQNDRFGVCGPVSVANDVRLVSAATLGSQIILSEDAVFDLYRRSGNPGFNSITGEDDNGVDMQTMLEALLKDGIGGLKPIAFAGVDPQNIDAIEACISIFGGVLFGAMLSTAQNNQTDAGGPWEYAPGSPPWGGHAFVGGRYRLPSVESRESVGVATWAEVLGITQDFIWNQMMEAWVVIWPWHLDHPGFQAGIDLQGLAEDYEELTGRKLDIPVPKPEPEPEPAPVQLPDEVFAEAANEWLRHRHAGINHEFALSVRQWLAAKGQAQEQ